jgi:prevent-host-death family protein
MREGSPPATETIAASEARAQWSRLLNQVVRKQTRGVVERSGIPVAAIVSADDLVLLQRLEEQRERGFAAAERISRAFADVPVEELERRVAEAVAQARAERSAKDEATATQRS